MTFIIDRLFYRELSIRTSSKTLFDKDSGAGKDWGQEEKGTTEDKMAGWHH